MPESPVHVDPEILDGTPVFVGTRVPVRILFEYLADGQPLDNFLDCFPTVTKERAVAFLDQQASSFATHLHDQTAP